MVDRKRNGNKANNGGKWIRPEKRRAIYVRDDLACVYCGKHIDDGIELTLDHLLPQELGGSNDEKNLVTACKQCNSCKGTKTLSQFVSYLKHRNVDTDLMKKRIRRNLSRKLKIVRG